MSDTQPPTGAKGPDMKDFAGNEINEAAMLQAIAAINWSRTDPSSHLGGVGVSRRSRNNERPD